MSKERELIFATGKFWPCGFFHGSWPAFCRLPFVIWPRLLGIDEHVCLSGELPLRIHEGSPPPAMTIIPDLDSASPAAVGRSMIHWIGGIGIVVFFGHPPVGARQRLFWVETRARHFQRFRPTAGKPPKNDHLYLLITATRLEAIARRYGNI